MTLGAAATEDLKISQKCVTDDLIKVKQTLPEIQTYEVPTGTIDKHSPNEPQTKDSTESKILTEKIDSSHEQVEPTAKSLIPEEEILKANKTSDTVIIDQKEKSESAKGNSEVAENLIGEKDSALIKDQHVDKYEHGDSGVKTDEEDNEEEENEDDEKNGFML